MNILQIINEPWDSAVTDYGIAQAKGLKEKGHYVLVAGLKNTVPLRKAEQAGIDILCDIEFNVYNPVRLAYSISRLRNILQEHNINIINSLRSEGCWLGYIASRGLNVKIIRTRGEARTVQNNYINHRMYNKWISFVILPSEMAKKKYIPFNLVHSEVIYYGISPDEFTMDIDAGRKIRKRWGICDDEIVFGVVGRLDPVKGHKYFIQAAAIVANSIDKVRFVIIGEEKNTRLSELIALCHETGIKDKVIFTTHRLDNICEYYSAIDIGVIPSIGSEVISRVGLEFMSCEVPVIVTDVGVLPEIVDNTSGVVIPAAQVEIMATEMMNMAQNKERIKVMGKNARARVGKYYHKDIFVNKTEQIFIDVVEDRI
jgi:glycosyltransferase involved in cell wall biosynthesis